MRVTYLIDAAFLGGAERYIAHVMNALDRARFAPSLVAPVREAMTPALDAWVSDIAASGIPVRRAQMRFPFRPFDAPGILRAIAHLEPDLVHVNMPGPYNGLMGTAPAFARMAGARAVVTTEHLPMVERLWKRAAVRRLGYRYADRIMTVCRANVPWLTDRQGVPARRIDVVVNALDVTYGSDRDMRDSVRAQLGLGADEVAVLFVGNLLDHKGPHRVVEALCGLADSPWRLIIVGDGEMRETCNRILEQAGQSHRAHFTGSVGAEDVERYLAAGDILALPSTMEGMPYVILEAMASSLPVVSSPLYGIPETVTDGENGYLVEPLDVASICDALRRLIESRELREGMGARGRERFEAEFTIDRQRDRIADVYERAIEGKRVHE